MNSVFIETKHHLRFFLILLKISFVTEKQKLEINNNAVHSNKGQFLKETTTVYHKTEI